MESSATENSRKNAFAFIEFLQFLIRVFSYTLLQPSLFRCKRSGNEFNCRMVFSLKLKTTSQWFALLLNIPASRKTLTHKQTTFARRSALKWAKKSFIWKRRKRRKFNCISEKMKTCSWNKARWMGILIIFWKVRKFFKQSFKQHWLRSRFCVVETAIATGCINGNHFWGRFRITPRRKQLKLLTNTGRAWQISEGVSEYHPRWKYCS